ncbi:carboxypeptidase M32 [Tetragenococcus halophilus]|uniref:Metal-dependent carboxypeptidase n=1 Tax=Tetragenococcus halophilus TaxID=51669 RepID=A0AB35HMK1_TETHA|nr:carboxypeptidase M32 [Tetragenococcus halophilus]MCF1601169.1 carboxypeptidase M32 [Tetragenococcus halophilus]MCF1675944.1 carboxypeptidase M32 [Tetragenococcus halophilus]MCO7025579.1 carboxypeptidase M32 [Tetragenococcus halophilus]MCO8285718.1 carboxypeptidase M32 [Tetragenococcus halophilus]MCO8287807.1 carboxypeptidase M32 [Tetragenococcus halophilus]
MKEQEFLTELKEMDMLQQALAILEWDAQTGMPAEASNARAEVSSYLYGKYFSKKIGPKMSEAIEYFSQHPEKLSEVGKAALTLVKEEYEREQAVPNELMVEYSKATANAHHAWQKARQAKDFSLFYDALKNNIRLTKELISYWKKDEQTDYDVLLNIYEPNMTTETLDDVFSTVRDGIMAIYQKIENYGIKPRTDFLHRKVAKEQQQKFVTKVVEDLGFDLSRGRIDDTIHPFATGINHQDVRLTNRWNETDFSMGIFGLIHEAGHGVYEQNIAEKFEYTPVHEGASMGIHESQSLFNELVIASRKSFWQKQYPFLQECVDGTFADISFTDFYASLQQTQASLIRIEADSLTYILHIIIRYEIEKMIFNEEVKVEDLPQLWNDKYEKYLGVRPANDLEGILQDVHWSAAEFGYFPSYALGYMYACQLYYAMKKELDVDQILKSDDYSAIQKWLSQNIHQYGASKKPNQLIYDASGEALNPQYLLDYLQEIYFAVYQISE